MSDAMVSHWDACLGCMACVTACPSGVQYDTLIEQTRAQVERRHERSAKDRALRGLIFSLFPHPRRLRLLRGPLRLLQASGLDRALRRTGLLERMAPQLAAMERLAPRLGKPERLPERIPPSGPRRAVVGLLTGCVQGAFFPGVNAATARVLAGRGLRRRGAEGRRAAAVRCRCTTAASPRGRPTPGSSSTPSSRLRRGVRRGELGRLRLHDEGVRRPAGRRPGVRRPRPCLHRPGPRRRRDPRRARPGRAATPARDDHRLPRRLPPRPRPGRARAAAAAARGDPGTRAPRDRRVRAVLRLRRHLQHPQPRHRPSELGDRKAANIVATGADAAGHRQPGLPDAGHLGHRTLRHKGATRWALAHTIEVLDASIRGTPVAALLADTDLPT